MRGSSVVSGIHNLKLAKDYFEDFCREHPNSIGEKKLHIYIKKIDWIFTDFLTTSMLTDEVRDGVRKEINSDALLVPELHRKMALLNPEQREGLEDVIDCILSGQTIEVISK